MFTLRVLFTGLVALLTTASFAANAPDCYSNKAGANLGYNNEQVLTWKTTTRSQFHDRGNVRGTLVKVLRTRDSHSHFEVQIGARESDSIEIVYNRSFGELPVLTRGLSVEVCGDYITTGAGSNGSVTGAILHWTHMNPGDRDGGKHEHGHVFIEGKLYGHDYQRGPGFFEDLLGPWLNPEPAFAF